MSSNDDEAIRVFVRLRPEQKNEVRRYGAPCVAIAGNASNAIQLSANGEALENSHSSSNVLNSSMSSSISSSLDESCELRTSLNRHRDSRDTPKVFSYDRVFDRQASQEQVFEHVTDLVDSVIDGYNSTIFAYGATGSGKTFSMSGTELQPGIVPRSIHRFFAKVKDMASSEPETLFMVRMGFVELYNNTFRDLLAEFGDENRRAHRSRLDNSSSSLHSSKLGDFDSSLRSNTNDKYERDMDLRKQRPRIEVRESPTGGVHLVGSKTLRMHIRNAEDALSLVAAGNRARATAATNLNEHSSRSHSILTIHVESQRKVVLDSAKTKVKSGGDSTKDKSGHGIVCLGKMHLVDLAGSERLGMSGVQGARARETQNINLSLSALGNVLSALSKYHVLASRGDPKYRKLKPRVPYRDSKLTYLLRDSLGGNSKTLMLTTVRAPTAFYQQTKMSLMYASRAKKIKNKTFVNTDAIGASEMQQVVGQVEQLRMKLLERTAEFQRLRGMQSQSSQESEELKRRLKRLQSENEREKRELEQCMREVISNKEGDLEAQKRAYNELQSNVAMHEQTMENQKKEIAKLANAVRSGQNEAGLLRRALKSCQEDAERIRRQRDAAASQLTAESHRIQSIVRGWDKQKKTMQERIAQLEGDLVDAKKNNNAASTAEDDDDSFYKVERDAFQVRIQALEESGNKLRERCLELEGERSSAVSILQSAAEDVKSLKEALREERGKVERHQTERKEERKKMEKEFESQLNIYQEEHERRLSGMRAEIDRAEAKAAEAIEQSKQFMKTRDAATVAESKARKLSSQLEVARNQVRTYEEDRKRHSEKESAREQKLAQVRLRLKIAEDKCAKYGEEVSALKDTMSKSALATKKRVELLEAEVSEAVSTRDRTAKKSAEIERVAAAVKLKAEEKIRVAENQAKEGLEEIRAAADKLLQEERAQRKKGEERLARAMEAISLFEQKVASQAAHGEKAEADSETERKLRLEAEDQIASLKATLKKSMDAFDAERESIRVQMNTLEKTTILREQRVDQLEAKLIEAEKAKEAAQTTRDELERDSARKVADAQRIATEIAQTESAQRLAAVKFEMKEETARAVAAVQSEKEKAVAEALAVAEATAEKRLLAVESQRDKSLAVCSDLQSGLKIAVKQKEDSDKCLDKLKRDQRELQELFIEKEQEMGREVKRKEEELANLQEKLQQQLQTQIELQTRLKAREVEAKEATALAESAATTALEDAKVAIEKASEDACTKVRAELAAENQQIITSLEVNHTQELKKAAEKAAEMARADVRASMEELFSVKMQTKVEEMRDEHVKSVLLLTSEHRSAIDSCMQKHSIEKADAVKLSEERQKALYDIEKNKLIEERNSLREVSNELSASSETLKAQLRKAYEDWEVEKASLVKKNESAKENFEREIVSKNRLEVEKQKIAAEVEKMKVAQQEAEINFKSILEDRIATEKASMQATFEIQREEIIVEAAQKEADAVSAAVKASKEEDLRNALAKLELARSVWEKETSARIDQLKKAAEEGTRASLIKLQEIHEEEAKRALDQAVTEAIEKANLDAEEQIHELRTQSETREAMLAAEKTKMANRIETVETMLQNKVQVLQEDRDRCMNLLQQAVEAQNEAEANRDDIAAAFDKKSKEIVSAMQLQKKLSEELESSKQELADLAARSREVEEQSKCQVDTLKLELAKQNEIVKTELASEQAKNNHLLEDAIVEAVTTEQKRHDALIRVKTEEFGRALEQAKQDSENMRKSMNESFSEETARYEEAISESEKKQAVTSANLEALSLQFEEYKEAQANKAADEAQTRQETSEEIESLKSRLVEQHKAVAESRTNVVKTESEREQMEKAAAALTLEMQAIQQNANMTLERLQQSSKDHERDMGEKQGVIDAQMDRIARLEKSLEAEAKASEIMRAGLLAENTEAIEVAVANATKKLEVSEADAVKCAVDSAKEDLNKIWRETMVEKENLISELRTEVAAAHVQREKEVGSIGEKVELLQEAHVAQVSQMKESVIKLMKDEMEKKVSELRASHEETLKKLKTDSTIALKSSQDEATAIFQEERESLLQQLSKSELASRDAILAAEAKAEKFQEDADSKITSLEAEIVEKASALKEAEKKHASDIMAAANETKISRENAKAEIFTLTTKISKLNGVLKQKENDHFKKMSEMKAAHAGKLKEVLELEEAKYESLRASEKERAEEREKKAIANLNAAHNTAMLAMKKEVEEQVGAKVTNSLEAIFEEKMTSRLEDQRSSLSAIASSELESARTKANDNCARLLERIAQVERDRDTKIAEHRVDCEDKLKANQEMLTQERHLLKSRIDEAVSAAVAMTTANMEEETKKELLSKEQEFQNAMQVMQTTYHGQALAANEAAVQAALDTARAQAEMDLKDRLEQVIERERASHLLELDAAVENAVEISKRDASAARLALEREFVESRESFMAEATAKIQSAENAALEDKEKSIAATTHLKEVHAKEMKAAIEKATVAAVKEQQKVHNEKEKLIREKHEIALKKAINEAVSHERETTTILQRKARGCCMLAHVASSISLNSIEEGNNVWRWLDPGTAGVHAAFCMWRNFSRSIQKEEQRLKENAQMNKVQEELSNCKNEAEKIAWSHAFGIICHIFNRKMRHVFSKWRHASQYFAWKEMEQSVLKRHAEEIGELEGTLRCHLNEEVASMREKTREEVQQESTKIWQAKLDAEVLKATEKSKAELEETLEFIKREHDIEMQRKIEDARAEGSLEASAEIRETERKRTLHAIEAEKKNADWAVKKAVEAEREQAKLALEKADNDKKAAINRAVSIAESEALMKLAENEERFATLLSSMQEKLNLQGSEIEASVILERERDLRCESLTKQLHEAKTSAQAKSEKAEKDLEELEERHRNDMAALRKQIDLEYRESLDEFQNSLEGRDKDSSLESESRPQKYDRPVQAQVASLLQIQRGRLEEEVEEAKTALEQEYKAKINNIQEKENSLVAQVTLLKDNELQLQEKIDLLQNSLTSMEKDHKVQLQNAISDAIANAKKAAIEEREKILAIARRKASQSHEKEIQALEAQIVAQSKAADSALAAMQSQLESVLAGSPVGFTRGPDQEQNTGSTHVKTDYENHAPIDESSNLNKTGAKESMYSPSTSFEFAPPAPLSFILEKPLATNSMPPGRSSPPSDFSQADTVVEMNSMKALADSKKAIPIDESLRGNEGPPQQDTVSKPKLSSDPRLHDGTLYVTEEESHESELEENAATVAETSSALENAYDPVGSGQKNKNVNVSAMDTNASVKAATFRSVSPKQSDTRQSQVVTEGLASAPSSRSRDLSLRKKGFPSENSTCSDITLETDAAISTSSATRIVAPSAFHPPRQLLDLSICLFSAGMRWYRYQCRQNFAKWRKATSVETLRLRALARMFRGIQTDSRNLHPFMSRNNEVAKEFDASHSRNAIGSFLRRILSSALHRWRDMVALHLRRPEPVVSRVMGLLVNKINSLTDECYSPNLKEKQISVAELVKKASDFFSEKLFDLATAPSAGVSPTARRSWFMRVCSELNFAISRHLPNTFSSEHTTCFNDLREGLLAVISKAAAHHNHRRSLGRSPVRSIGVAIATETVKPSRTTDAHSSMGQQIMLEANIESASQNERKADNLLFQKTGIAALSEENYAYDSPHRSPQAWRRPLYIRINSNSESITSMQQKKKNSLLASSLHSSGDGESATAVASVLASESRLKLNDKADSGGYSLSGLKQRAQYLNSEVMKTSKLYTEASDPQTYGHDNIRSDRLYRKNLLVRLLGAAYDGDVQELSFLLRKHKSFGVNTRAEKKSYQTGSTETRLLPWLIRKCASENTATLSVSRDDMLPLHRAVSGFHFHGNASRTLEALQLLVHEGGADVNAVDSSGNSVLHRALLAFTAATIKDAVSCICTSLSGYLRGTSTHRHIQGLNVNARNSKGETALHVEVKMMRNVSEAVVSALLDSRCTLGDGGLLRRADPNLPDVEGRTPLILALTLAHRHGSRDVYSVSSLASQARASRKTPVGSASPSAMRAAVWSGGSYWIAVAKLLVDSGARWWTPLVSLASATGLNSNFVSVKENSNESVCASETTSKLANYSAINAADCIPFRDRSWRTPLHLLMEVIPSLSSGSATTEVFETTHVYAQHHTLLLLTRQCLREMSEGNEAYSSKGVGILGSPTSTFGWDWTNVDARDKKGATALLCACRSLALLPSQEPDHGLFKWAQDLLHALVSSGADIHARDEKGASPAVLGPEIEQQQRRMFLEGGSLYEAVWPRVRAISKSLSGARFKSTIERIERESSSRKMKTPASYSKSQNKIIGGGQAPLGMSAKLSSLVNSPSVGLR